jgi:sugar/nucleoside kinase (ribokinase family)
MYDVTAIGELLIDFSFVSADAEGYPTMAANPGGAPCNFLAALAAYGGKAAFLGKVGNDTFGQLLIRTLQKAGVETKGILVDDSVFTTLAFVTLNAAGDRTFSFARKPGADTCLRFDELDHSLINDAKVFHFGTLSLTDEPARRATQKSVKRAISGGKLISFDPNLRPSLWVDLSIAKEQILWGLGKADILKISREEVEFLWGCSPQEGAAKLIGEYGVKLVMITLDSDGCYLANKNGQAQIACPPVKVLDTTGAGDIFGGSALSRILQLGTQPDELREHELWEIGSFAVTAASLSTQRPGGIPSIPNKDEVLAVLGKMRRENK